MAVKTIEDWWADRRRRAPYQDPGVPAYRCTVFGVPSHAWSAVAGVYESLAGFDWEKVRERVKQLYRRK